MKKFLIIIGVLIIIIIGWIVINSLRQPKNANTNQLVTGEPPVEIKPWEITVGLFDPATEPNKLTKLLESRLKEIGFKTIILKELVDPEAANQEKTTLLFRTDTEKKLTVVIREIINSNLYRKGQNEAILQDVIFSAWNIEDINWGSFSDLANQYNNPNPAEVSIIIINAGAPSGTAGQLTELLMAQGYTKTEAKDAEADEVADKPALIYYNRNYKNVAKNLRKILSDNGYSEVTYRPQLNQESNIVIKLGLATTTTDLVPAE